MFFDLANHFVPSCFYFRDCNFNSIRIFDCQIKIFELGYQHFCVTQHVVNKIPQQHTTYNISKNPTQHNIQHFPTFLLYQHVGKCCTTCCVVSSLCFTCYNLRDGFERCLCKGSFAEGNWPSFHVSSVLTRPS